MKRTLLIALCVVLGASAAFAQGVPGAINVYATPLHNDCNIYDTGPSLITLEVVHEYGVFVGSSLFKLNMPDCVGGIGTDWTLLGSIIPWDLTIGDLFTGISIAYGTCSNSPLLLATINYFGNGLTPPCCYITVEADPGAASGQVEVVDCSLNRMLGVGGSAIVNPDGSCECNVPVDTETWGGIKALYQ
jgi:hypothetical protein